MNGDSAKWVTDSSAPRSKTQCQRMDSRRVNDGNQDSAVDLLDSDFNVHLFRGGRNLGDDAIDFFVECIPPKATAQASSMIMRRQDGTPFIGKAKRGAKTRDELMVLLMPHRPIAPLEGAIFMEVDWVYPWRKSEPKKNKVDGKLPCFTRPDCDNLCKFFADICERLGFYLDDAQIADLRFRKWWGDCPGIGVKMGRVGE